MPPAPAPAPANTNVLGSWFAALPGAMVDAIAEAMGLPSGTAAAAVFAALVAHPANASPRAAWDGLFRLAVPVAAIPAAHDPDWPEYVAIRTANFENGLPPTRRSLQGFAAAMAAARATQAQSGTCVRHKIEIPHFETNEGVPGTCRSFRVKLVNDLCNMLFPLPGTQVSAMPVIVVKAPPLSGKTGLAQLLAKKLGECASRSVVFLRANQMRVEDSVEVFFAKEVGESLCDFLQRSEERVLLIDEAQCTYTDSDFWKNIVKSTLSGGYNTELRIVLLSSFGSFDPLRKSDREGTPIQIPPRNTFSLRGDFGGETSEDEECEEFIDPVFVKPTLALTEGEFNEMAEGSVIQQCHDLAWNLASNHIGVAKGLLDFVNDRFKNKFSVTANDIERILLSRELVSWFQSMRGFPSIERFTTVVKYNALNDRVTAAGMLNILDQVACGNTYRFQNEFGSPGTQAALELLTKFGFLFEADNGCLNFASQMHLKVWLFSIRTDPIEYLVNCQDFDAFLVASISRMHGTRLAAFRKGNDCKKVRERQMQMELYTAICSILPRDFHVTPEWRTSHKKEYINLVVNLSKGVIWFLELLVDGKEAIEHEKRFLCGGKYSSSLNPKSKYGLIDFRESVAVRNEKPGFTHVSFGDGYKKAFVSCPSQEVKTVFPL